MPDCDAGGGCSNHGTHWCMCIRFDHGCICDAGVVAAAKKRKPSGLKGLKRRFGLDTKVGFCARNASLFDIGILLDRCFPYYQIAVPVAKAKKKVNLTVKEKALGDVVASLGLTTMTK